MSKAERAKQFMPFDALKGLNQALRLKEYEHEKTIKGDLSEEKILEISSTLLELKNKDEVECFYFDDGYEKTIKGKVKLEIEMGFIVIENLKIELEKITNIKKCNF